VIAISILQPWAWLIVHGPKDIENRTWSTKRRGDVIIHAGKRWGREQHEDLEFVREKFPHVVLPERFDLGGIVGTASILDCVQQSESPWFSGPYGLVLANRRPSPRFIPWKGQLGFFHIPQDVFQ
jgi:hypothetical protein